jgi:hypothetical protein
MEFFLELFRLLPQRCNLLFHSPMLLIYSWCSCHVGSDTYVMLAR